MGVSRDWTNDSLPRNIVAAAVLGATNAGTTAVDMRAARQGTVIISTTVGTDVATDVTIEHSADNSTFTEALDPLADALFAATGINVVEIPDMMRYVRATWTRAAAGGDSYWSITILGHEAIRSPVSAS